MVHPVLDFAIRETVLNLELEVVGASHLPKMERYKFGDYTKKALRIKRGSVDPYVTVTIIGASMSHTFKTPIVHHNYNPMWHYLMECKTVPDAAGSVSATFEVFHYDAAGNDRKCGQASLIFDGNTVIKKPLTIPLLLEQSLHPSGRHSSSSLTITVHTLMVKVPPLLNTIDHPLFNGFYVSSSSSNSTLPDRDQVVPVGTIFNVLRFYPDKSVLITSIAPPVFQPHLWASWFHRESPKFDFFRAGSWRQTTPNILAISLISSESEVAFHGVNIDGKCLRLDIVSNITKTTTSKIYRFVEPAAYGYTFDPNS
jgi:hypothetical protein